MNILHMKYAVEVAKAGSINKASDNLLIAQPNLSRSIKELEADLGITIFDRSAKGMVLTPEGEEFISYATKILSQIDEVEEHYKTGGDLKQRFSLSAPRACYISEAFSVFTKSLANKPCEISYNETNTFNTIQGVLNEDFKLGIIRYASNHDSYYKGVFEEKGLAYEMITDMHYVLITSKNSNLAEKESIKFSDLTKKIEIVHGDPYVPSLSVGRARKEELPGNVERRILLFERGSQFELLSENPETYMWVSPVPQKTLDRYDLIQLECEDNKKLYKDVLIYKENYKLSSLDNVFISELCQSKRKYIK